MKDDDDAMVKMYKQAEREEKKRWEIFLFFVFLLSKITAEFVRPLDLLFYFFTFFGGMMTLLLFRPMEILPDHCEEFAVVRREELPQNGNHLIRYLLLEQKKEINRYLFDLKKNI